MCYPIRMATKWDTAHTATGEGITVTIDDSLPGQAVSVKLIHAASGAEMVIAYDDDSIARIDLDKWLKLNQE